MISRFTRILFCIFSLGLFSQLSSAQDASCGTVNGNLVVTNVNDSGPGSLRAAINCANQIEGSNRITFSIATSGRKTIFVGETTGEPLPSLSDKGTIIDGSFQPGSTDRPRIILDGSKVNWNAPVNGLLVLEDDCEIYGLEIRNFPDDGIDIFGADNVKVGAPFKGNVIYSCGETKDFYEGTNPSGPWEGSGIALRNGSEFCEIKSNYIGTNANSTTNFANEYCGILITGNSNGNQIGGATRNEVNIIAFNPTAIRVDASVQNPLLGNSIVCNDTAAIVLTNNGNNLKKAPIVLTANDENISGRGLPGDRIEIFLNTSRACADQPCQGQLSVGTAIVNRDSLWAFTITGTVSFGNIDFLEYDLATATATDANGNTSNFSSCRIVNIAPGECAESDGTIWVTNNLDDGPGSLRAAIECANSIGGANTIKFNLEGSERHIFNIGATTQQELPALTDNNTIIDATTQTGFGANGNFEPRIVLDGASSKWDAPINGIWIRGNNCEVYGLEIRNFPDDGIDVTAASNVIIGAAGKGNVVYNCGYDQDFWANANPIGPWEGCGIVIKGGSRNCTIAGNILGTNYNRTFNSGNEYCGINIGRTDQNILIGGENQAAGNVIAYNPTGILLNSGSKNIQILQNSFLCNDTLAIGLLGNANGSKSAPIITDYNSSFISGTADSGDRIEVFVSSTEICPDQPCQGRIFLGSTFALGDGTWRLELTEADDNTISDVEVVTATATNSAGNTSVFADCFTKAEVNCSAFRASISERQDETCDSDNGTFTVAVTGGTTPYTFNIGNGPTISPNFTNLNAGTYSITITDANGCEATQATAIRESDPLSIIIVDQENAVCDQSTGEFSVLASGSIAPYTYDIGNGPTNELKFTALAPGEYEVTVTDATGCTMTEFVEIGNDAGLELNLSQVRDANCGENNGVVTAVATEGIEPIVYTIGSGVSSNPTFRNLAPGFYTLTATDANGCTAEEEFIIGDTPKLQLQITDIKNADCDERGGVITVSTTGGLAPVSYNYGAGTTTNPTFTDLFPGTYLITATDANGCTAVQSARVDASGDLELTIDAVIDASCNRENGGFTVVPVSGLPPYKYDIGNGETLSPIFTGLATGEYTVTVTDLGGCMAMHDITINTISPLSLEVVNVRNADCSNNRGGSFTLLPSGGTLPISYSISGNTSTSNPTFSNLAAGTYTIVATDAIGCEFERQIVIAQTGSLTIINAASINATCGQENGAFIVTNSSGKAPYQYQIAGRALNNSLENLAAGSYEVLVVDANGCSVTTDLTIQDEVSLTAEIQSVRNASCGRSNGQFRVAATNGTAPYTYSIGNNETNNPIFTNLSGGFYEVIISDAAGCTISKEIFIEESLPITAEIIAPIDASCGQESGGFTVEVITGTAPYEYNIGFGLTSNPVFRDLPAGTYTVSVTDANGCETKETAIVNSAATELATRIENIEDATCGEDNGSFEVIVANGTAPYTYRIGNTEQNNPVFSDLAPNTYTVSVTDASGCSSEHDLTIVRASQAINANVSNIAAAKCGQSNGSFQIQGRNGVAPYRYDIGFGVTLNSTFNNLSGGVYEVTVLDNVGCRTTRNITIEESDPLTARIINLEEDNCGQSNGAFEVEIVSGTAPFSYNIGNGFTENPIFTNLEVGTYNLKIRDVNGCETDQFVNIGTNGDPINASIQNVQDATCGNDNGAFSVNVRNGQAPYTYILNGENYNTPNFDGLAAGTYDLFIFDAAGCSSEQSITIEESGTSLEASVSNISIAQCGQSNGRFSVNVNGGTAPYSYNIGFGATNNSNFTQVSGGTYELTITDALGCSTTKNITIQETNPLTARIVNPQDESCGQNNGSFSVEIDSGTAPYSYNIGNGFTENPNFTNLNAGNYTLTVQDVNGCTNTQQIRINESNTALATTIENIEDATCGANNGSFEVVVANGTAPYIYNIGNGTTSNPIFNNLSPNAYTVSVTDAAGCVSEHDLTIIRASQAINANVSSIAAAKCGQSNGSFRIQGTGGLAPYRYNIGLGVTLNSTFNNLSGGIYKVTVLDNAGCSTTRNITIEETAPLTASIINLKTEKCGKANGGFEVKIESGTAPYSYNIGNGFTENPVFANLEAGTYTVTVRDVNGCETDQILNIAASGSSISASIQNVQDATCGNNNGAFSVNVASGQAPYTYTLNGTNYSTPNFENLAPGTYKLFVFDAAGCSSEQSITIEASGTNLEASVSNISIAQCGQSNGRFSVNVNGGTAPYSYNIGFGESSDPNFTQVSGGVYELTITDALGCEITEQIEIAETDPITVEITNLQDATCGQRNGRFDVEILSGTAPFSYSIGNGFTENTNFTSLASGSYTLTVQDVNGCSTTEQININQSFAELSASIENVQASNCGEENGSFQVVTNNGSAPFTYDIGNGATNNPLFENLAFGEYEVTVTDLGGCSTTLQVNIEQGLEGVTGEEIQNINATCGRSNGSFTIQATSGVAPFTYDIGTGVKNSPLFQNLSQGIYTVTITDLNGCKGTVEIFVDETNPITAEAQNIENATCGEPNGSFEIVVNSGAAPFTYDIGAGITTNPRFTGLDGGSYNVTITDANFCATTKQINIDQSSPVRSNIVESIGTSCGETNGSVSISATGGTAPYQFNIGNGATENNVFSGLAGGNYVVTVTDSEGCETAREVEITNSTPIKARLIGPTNAFCGETNGAFAVSASNGTEPYRYDIGNGTTSDPNFGNLAAGTYVVTITDARNCTTTVQAVIQSSSNVTFSIRKEDDPCANGFGSITVVPSGGVTPYMYDIGNGATSSNKFENLTPGNYEITVTDAAGCEAVANSRIDSDSDLNLVVLSRKRPTCGDSNGKVVVSVGGGVTPYQYNIGDGNSGNSTFENLAPGDYVVSVVDGIGCTAEVAINLPSESEPPVAEITEKLDVSCAGNDGRFSISASGGLAPYTYNIGGGASTNTTFSNLTPDNYEVTITDANGCFTIQNIVIEGAENLEVAVENVKNENCNAANGAFDIIASGGTAPYRYDIGNGLRNNANFSALTSGTYTVTVLDARNCESTQSITIERVNDLAANVTNKVKAACTEENGAFTVLPTGGTAPYRYNIGNGFTASPRFEGLASGNYDITILDANECTYQTRTTVEGTDAPEAVITNLEDATCGEANGKVTVLATRGTSPYTYDIGNGSTTSNNFNNLSDGTYDLTITDANGCNSILPITIAMIGSLPSASFIIDTTGLEIELENTSSNYDSLSWDLGDGVTYGDNNVVHSYLQDGTYTICLTTMNDCGSDTQCQEITVEGDVQRANLGGFVYTELDFPISEVKVSSENMDTLVTDIDGLYSFDRLVKDSSYTVTPSKLDGILNGVSTYDIFLMNNHILTKELLDSPYKIIAADVNKSGSVTTFDVVLLRKVLLGLSNDFPNGNTSWRFVDASYEFPDPKNPFAEPFPEQATVDLDNTVSNVNFIGVKVGDVNNSVVTTPGANSVEGRQLSTQFLEATWSADGAEIILSIPAGIAGLQFTLEYDQSQLKISDLTPATLQDLGNQNFALNRLQDGKLAASWNTTHTLNAPQEFARLKVQNYGAKDLAKALKITSSIIAAEAFSSNERYALDLKTTARKTLQLYDNAPNPFDTWTQLHFDLPEAAKVRVMLYNAKGKLLRTIEQEMGAGEQYLPIERGDLPVGLIYYRLEAGGEVVTGKMIGM